jgi:hypothetical protein
LAGKDSLLESHKKTSQWFCRPPASGVIAAASRTRIQCVIYESNNSVNYMADCSQGKDVSDFKAAARFWCLPRFLFQTIKVICDLSEVLINGDMNICDNMNKFLPDSKKYYHSLTG